MSRYWALLISFVAVLSFFWLSCDQTPTTPSPTPEPFDTLNTPCGTQWPYSCRDSMPFMTEFGETLTHVIDWTPETRTLYDLMYDREYIRTSYSYVHVYNSRMQDSIVYWVTTLNDTDTVYVGWGKYVYDTQNRIKQINNFNGWDSAQYGYFKYDTLGNKIEKKQDDQIWHYDTAGNEIVYYWENSADTTFCFYDDTSKLIEKHYVSGDYFTRKIFYDPFVDSVSRVTVNYNDSGLLSYAEHSDTIFRYFRIIAYEPDSTIIADTLISYSASSLYTRESVVVRNGQQDTLFTWLLNDTYHVVSQVDSSGDTMTCAEPLTRDGCASP